MSVEALFDDAAGDYDASRRMLVSGFDGFYGAVLESAPPEREAPVRVPDFGAGRGLLSAMAAERFPLSRVTLVDLSVEMLRMARWRFAGRFAPDLNRFEFCVMDCARKALPGGAGGYDRVVSALSIHRLTRGDKRELFEKVRGSLADGGRS